MCCLVPIIVPLVVLIMFKTSENALLLKSALDECVEKNYSMEMQENGEIVRCPSGIQKISKWLKDVQEEYVSQTQKIQCKRLLS